jgi:hypothetical protein
MFLLPSTHLRGCAGYLAYPFHNQEVNSHTGNFNNAYLMRKFSRKRTGRAILSALFWNGYAKWVNLHLACVREHSSSRAS